MDERVFICGNFGFRNNQIDGQTVKTRIMKDEIQSKIGDKKVLYSDTSFIKDKPILFFRNMKKNFSQSSHTIISPGRRGLTIILPLILMWNSQKKDKDIRYVVIGGWLPEYLKKNNWLLECCKKLDGIYVETESMVKSLNKIGIQNCKLLPNFRKVNRKCNNFRTVGNQIKLVYFSRVAKEKGVLDAINAINIINSKRGLNNLTLDIYGPIQKGFENEFMNIMNGCDTNIKYKGVLSQEEISNTLVDYDLMVFPTYYDGEGFPGAVIDAFISGVPVLASDWKYNTQVITEHETGFIFQVNNVNDLVDKLEYIDKNKNILNEMKKNAIVESKKYDTETVILNLLNDMGIDRK